MSPIYGKCGFECGRCQAFKANSQTEEDRRRGAAIWGQYFGLHFKADVLFCEGCQSEAPWKTGRLLPDRACTIRACAIHNGANTCAHCSLFPCKEYVRRVPGPSLRHEREAAAKRTISDAEWKAHLEPYDGQSHLATLHLTIQPGDVVSPRPFQKASVAPFPATTNLSVRRREQMQALHSVLTRALSRTGDTYAEQILIQRGRPYVAGLLWVMGLYGKLEDGSLVLRSADYPDRNECARLIRRADNNPHKTTQQAITALADAGITIGYEASNTGWTLTLNAATQAGSNALPGWMKDYVRTLAGRYGIPEYVGGYNLKGAAFKAFSRADMAVFQA